MRSIGERIGEQLNEYEIKDKYLVFHKHVEEKHGGERQEVELKVVSSCGNDGMPKSYIRKQIPRMNGGNSNAVREKDRIRCDDLPNLFEEGLIRTKKSNDYYLGVCRRQRKF